MKNFAAVVLILLGSTVHASDEQDKGVHLKYKSYETIKLNVALDDNCNCHYSPTYQRYLTPVQKTQSQVRDPEWQKSFEKQFYESQSQANLSLSRSSSFELIDPSKLPGWARYCWDQGKKVTVWWTDRASRIPDKTARRMFGFLGDEPVAHWELIDFRQSQVGQKALGVQITVKFYTGKH